MTDTTPTDPTADERVQAYLDDHGHHADAEHGFRAGLAAGFGDVSAWRERAEQAEEDAQTAEDRANTLASEAAEWKRLFTECHPIHLDGVKRARKAEDRAARYKACVESDDALLQAVIEAMGSRPDRDPIIAARKLVAERNALRERAEQAESALREVERRLREQDGYSALDANRGALLHIDSWRSGDAHVVSVERERDALQARIEAAENALNRWSTSDSQVAQMVVAEVRGAMSGAALAGDQPAPEPCSDEDGEEFCARCFAGVGSDEHHGKCVVTGYAEMGESAAEPAGDSTPEPPSDAYCGLGPCALLAGHDGRCSL